MISSEQIVRVQDSFVHCLPIADQVATTSYAVVHDGSEDQAAVHDRHERAEP